MIDLYIPRTIPGSKVKQINNLHIHHDPEQPVGSEFLVCSPPRLATGGRRAILEQFGTREAAEEFCIGNTDYLHGRGGRRR